MFFRTQKSSTEAKWLTKTQFSVLKNLHTVISCVNDKIVVKRLNKQIETLRSKMAQSQQEIVSSIDRSFKERMVFTDSARNETKVDDNEVEKEIIKYKSKLRENLARIDAISKSLSEEMPSRTNSLQSTIDAIKSTRKALTTTSSPSKLTYSAKKASTAREALAQHVSR